MEKKAIMINFLVTLILAIIIFVPACVVVTNLIKPDTQAKDSFLALAKEIKKVATTNKGSYMLIMEPGTAIVGFTKDTFKHCLRVGEQDLCETWKRPTDSECKSGSCICLIKDFSTKTSTNEIKYTSASCYNVGNVGLGLPKIKSGFTNKPLDIIEKDGFLISRSLERGEVDLVLPFDFKNRRTPVYLLNKDSIVYVCTDSECKDLDLTTSDPREGTSSKSTYGYS